MTEVTDRRERRPTTSGVMRSDESNGEGKACRSRHQPGVAIAGSEELPSLVGCTGAAIATWSPKPSARLEAKQLGAPLVIPGLKRLPKRLAERVAEGVATHRRIGAGAAADHPPSESAANGPARAWSGRREFTDAPPMCEWQA